MVINLEPYVRLDIFLLSLSTSFLVFFRHDLHLSKVLRPDTLMDIVKGEEGVVIVYMLKWQ